jgi:hypothetical protein
MRMAYMCRIFRTLSSNNISQISSNGIPHILEYTFFSYVRGYIYTRYTPFQKLLVERLHSCDYCVVTTFYQTQQTIQLLVAQNDYGWMKSEPHFLQ